MPKKRSSVISVEVVDETVEFTTADLCRSCGVHAEIIVEMVEHGILEPSDISQTHWSFEGNNLRRANTALRLQRDLGVNLAGAALALDLIDEIRTLRRRLRTQSRRDPTRD